MLMGVHLPNRKQAVRYFARIDDILKGLVQFNLETLIGNYIRYSQICAKAVRDALKTEFKASAEKTSSSSVKIVKVKKE
ncbi:ATP synthase subunit epsilon, mitochondrial [Myotis brandtii]|uniref:ATP synthase subunit epsilon, mitochondrial n=1 Tax=Myotis brandtii TaxID=109478 RepID=S7QF12_MYOBR|nr:ATP synthase subunit epsilon, mitochondrial [Myotis brandtii]